jgi:chemotaxis protein histidine kinase CheA
MAREEKGSPMGSVNSGSGSGSEGGSSLAARRARLRGSLSRASFPPDTDLADSNALEEPMPTSNSKRIKTEEATVQTAAEAVGHYLENYGSSVAPNPTPSTAPAPSSAPSPSPTPTAVKPVQISPVSGGVTAAAPAAIPAVSTSTPISTPVPAPVPAPTATSTLAPQLSGLLGPLPAVPDNALELLVSIDGALSACATNLAALQRLASEQTEVLKGLTSTLQNQTLHEIGLNLNSLTESMSAALEPMKSIGELVPAMDQLVSALDGRDIATPIADKLSPDQLVTSLADQLSAGLIDPWTFKCAYMAIYPTEHPADLLHRLVELLGAQRLPGDLFRAAYEAVQGAEPPRGRSTSSRTKSATASGTNDPSIPAAPEEIRNKLEELERANEELRDRQQQREQELQETLQVKEQELQSAQNTLNSRYDEFNSRYEEVAEALGKREDEYRTLIETKDMEIVEKESELNLLRAQMEELRNQTEDMVKDLQKQLTDMRSGRQDPPKPQQSSSFFDSAPQQRTTYDQTAALPQSPALPPHPASAQPAPVQQAMPPQPQQAPPAPVAVVAPQPPAGQAPPSGQSPAPRPSAPQQPAPTTPFAPGAGSYGSGVRAQVFEVIVRQALAGAPWREICAGPMQVNNISPEEVETEVKRRQTLLNK